jgi:VWFA-related protein
MSLDTGDAQMKRNFLLSMFTLCACAALVSGGQQSKPAVQDATQRDNATRPQSPPVKDQVKTKKDEDVVRISVTLVQVDAVVTDQRGKQVTDLKPEDFEIFEDNRRQRITNFSYVTAQPAAGEAAVSSSTRTNLNVPPGPPISLRREQVRRTIALVVDDLGMSFESIAQVRESLKKFVDQQMQPGDLVAIVRTGAGMGALQQFTADKRLLYAAIQRVRFNLMGGGGIGAFAPITPAPFAGAGGLGAAQMRQSIAATASTRAQTFAIGTLGALNLIVRGLRDFPGRKSVVLLSDGFRLFSSGSQDYRVLEGVRRIVDLANRASVVVYTIDPRGLQTTGLTAADNTAFLTTAEVNQQVADRGAHLFETQGGLNFLANQTGGFFVHNSNNVSDGISRVLDDQRGYYLLGYIPEQATFKRVQGPKAFHSISVKVKGTGLRVRSRTGFYGVSDEETRPPNTPAQQLLTALTSPFTSGDIHLKLTSLFGHESKTGSFMRSIMHIDARDISFSEDQDGLRKGEIEIIAFTLGSNGEIVGREARGYNLNVGAEGFQKLLDQGFIYVLNVPIKKPGGYQLRVAVRDVRAGRVGSASQFIDVPDIGKNRLTLSGLVVSGYDPPTARKATPAGTASLTAQPAASNTEGLVEAIDPSSTPAVRMLKRGTYLDYGFLIYNAGLDPKTKKPQLESQVILLKDGKQVFVTKVSPLNVGEEPDWKHIPAAGRLRLGDDLAPGEYMLQVIVTDKLAKEQSRWATQWMDFEVAN